MAMRILLLSFALVLLGACAAPAIKTSSTIAAVEKKTATAETPTPRIKFNIDPQLVIDSYRELVKITPQGEDYSQIRRRLADLELEISIDRKLSEDPGEVVLGQQESKQAINRYLSYMFNFPDRPDNDTVLYQLARAYALESMQEKSLEIMNLLAEKYPASEYIDEIQFRRGEMLFVEGDFWAAEQAYADVVNNHKRSVYYEKSLYKYGWAQFKQNKNEAAIDSFVQLLDGRYRKRQINDMELSRTLSRANRELLEDVLRVVSLSFSYLPSKQPISEYFNRKGKKSYEPLLYRNFGELYLSKGRVIDATEIYLSYGENYPFSEHAPIFHALAIDAFKKVNFTTELLAEKQAFIKKYDPTTPFWAQQNEATRSRLKPILTTHMYDVATHFHATARASKKLADYKVAASWYQRYLKAFPDDNRAPNINFLLAEARFDARQYADAIQEYEKTAYDYAPHKDSAEAGYAALIAYNELYKISKAEIKPDINNRQIQSSLRFSEKFPTDKRMPTVLIRTVDQFFDLKQYDKAEANAITLVNNETIKPNIKHRAWIIVAHSQFNLGKFPEAESSYKNVLKGLKPNDKKMLNEMREQLASSIYKQGEQASSQGLHKAAAEHFLRVGQVVPTSSKRIVADYDAANEFIKLKDWPNVITQLQGFRKKYPKEKKWQQGVSEKLALAYNSVGKPEQSADELMKLMSFTPQAQQKDMLWQVAELYNQADKPAKAVSIYKTYIKKYPDPLPQSIELHHKIAQYYQQRKDTRQHHDWLRKMIKVEGRGKQQRTARTRYLAASASLELIRPLHQSYSKTKLSSPLKKSLKRKKKLMQSSIDAYTKAAKYQVEEVTTAATYNIAEIYREFASSLLTSERPRNLNKEELEEYNYLLEDQAYPFEEKAIQIHEKNLSRVTQGSWDDWIKNSLKVLGKMMPFRYAKNEVTDKYVSIQP